MKKNDLLLIFVIVIVIGVLYLASMYISGDKGARVAVYQDKKIIDILPLYEDVEKTYSSEYGENTISIKQAKLSVIDSNCRNRICVDSMAISKTGETIVCLPHHFYVEIIGGKENEIDAIAE